MKLFILLTIFINFLSFCLIANPSIVLNESNNSVIEDLRKRGFNIKLVGEKRSKNHSHVSASGKAVIKPGDLTEVCNIEKISTIEFSNLILPESFANEIQNCNLESLKMLRFTRTKISNELACNISKTKNFQLLSFDDASISDEGFECLKTIKTIKTFDLVGANTYTDEGFCKFAKSGIKIDTLNMFDVILSKKGYECLLDFQDIRILSVKKWKNFSRAQMEAVGDLYLKKHGRKISVNTFEYDQP